MWVDFNMWNLVVHDAATGPQRVNFHQATVRYSEITVSYTGWSKSLSVPDDYNAYVRRIEKFWSPCIK